MANVRLDLLIENLSDLVKHFQHLEYKIDIKHIQAVRGLLLALIAKNQLIEMESQAVCFYLSPILCSSSQEQQTFAEHFNQFYGFLAPIEKTEQQEQKKDESPIPKLPKIPWYVAKGRLLAYLSAIIVVCVLCVFVWQYIPRYQISGRVVNEQGEAVLGATVQLGTQQSISGKTGEFSFTFMFSSDKLLEIHHPDYIPHIEKIHISKKNTYLKDIVISSQILRGQIIDEQTKESISNVLISIDIGKNTQSDKQGQYFLRFHNDRKIVNVTLAHPQYLPQSHELDFSHNKVLEKSFLLQKQTPQDLKEYTIRGQVKNNKAEEIRQASVFFLNETTATDDNGNFLITVKTWQERAILTVRHREYVETQQTVELHKAEIELPVIYLAQKSFSLYTLFSQISQMASQSVPNLPVDSRLWVLILLLVFSFCAWFLSRYRYFSYRELSVFSRDWQKYSLQSKTPNNVKHSSLDLPPIQDLRINRELFSNKIDYIKSAHATAQAAGCFIPIYQSQKRSPDYLILVDRRETQDHYAQWAQEVVKHIQQQGISAEVLYFDRDPYLCYDLRKKKNIALSQIISLYTGYRLLIFSDAEEFIDPFTGKARDWVIALQTWDVRTILTPQPVVNWGYREWLLTTMDFAILPMGTKGIKALNQLMTGKEITTNSLAMWTAKYPPLIEEYPTRWLEENEPETEVWQELQQQLRNYLGKSGYLWLQSCAVSPQLHWRITLHLGNHLTFCGRTLANETLLKNLIRLPWFRYGYMPHWLRYLLTKDLSYEKLQIQNLLQQLHNLGPLFIAKNQLSEGKQKNITDKIKFSQQKLFTQMRRRLSWRTRFALGIYKTLFVARPKTIPTTRIPQGWPAFLWKECWNEREGYVDFTIDSWGKLKHEEQVKLARAYQEWYARDKNLKLTRIVTPKSNYIKDLLYQLKIKRPETFVFKLIPPGKFWMGSPETEKERMEDEKRHKVIISKAFWIGETEVTQGQWQAVMGNNPARFKEVGLNGPVENISWNDCQEFCEKTGWKMPTEAQWEYACRAGTTAPFNLGENISAENVNYDGNYPYPGGKKGIYRGKTTVVKSLANENSWGCYDFHGNVWEWCHDWYDKEYYERFLEVDAKDPLGPKQGSDRVLRGGYWDRDARDCRSAYRDGDDPAGTIFYDGTGFRVLLSSSE